MQVVEDEAEGLLVCQRADEIRDRIDSLLPEAVTAEFVQAPGLVGLEHDAEQRREEGVRHVHAGLRECRLQLDADPSLRIRYAEAKPHANQLSDRPVGDRLGVGDTVTL